MVTKKKAYYVEEKSYDLVDLNEMELNIVQVAMTMYRESLVQQVNKSGYIEERFQMVEEIINKLDFEEE
jgi:hypothetical protein|tara:strand:+ start:276 stop:482 length:207 start_codon:yes stop_codon:yes gene_type:complete